MRLYKKNNLRLFFSYLLIIFLFSPPLVLSASDCCCSESRLLSETEYTVSECSIEKCTEDCSCSFSASENKVHGNFIFPGLIQSHMFKLIISSQHLNVMTKPDEPMHSYSSVISQMKLDSSIATHIYSTVLRI